MFEAVVVDVAQNALRQQEAVAQQKAVKIVVKAVLREGWLVGSVGVGKEAIVVRVGAVGPGGAAVGLQV